MNLFRYYTMGPLHSAVESVELDILSDHMVISSNSALDAIHQSLKKRTHMKYETGQHASSWRRILGSIFLTAISNRGTPVHITHLVLDGSTKCIIGRNFIAKLTVIILIAMHWCF